MTGRGRGRGGVVGRGSMCLCGGCLFLLSTVVTATRTISEAPIDGNHAEFQGREVLKETRGEVNRMWIEFSTSNALLVIDINQRGSMQHSKMRL